MRTDLPGRARVVQQVEARLKVTQRIFQHLPCVIPRVADHCHPITYLLSNPRLTMIARRNIPPPGRF
jgi:hypothetical protein